MVEARCTASLPREKVGKWLDTMDGTSFTLTDSFVVEMLLLVMQLPRHAKKKKKKKKKAPSRCTAKSAIVVQIYLFIYISLKVNSSPKGYADEQRKPATCFWRPPPPPPVI
jgi:hypothetical protein